MSDAKVCDNCGEKLILDGPSGREDANGELAGWIGVVVGDKAWDACTRSCATELLADEGPVRPIVDAWSEVIADIARTIREEGEAGQ